MFHLKTLFLLTDNNANSMTSARYHWPTNDVFMPVFAFTLTLAKLIYLSTLHKALARLLTISCHSLGSSCVPALRPRTWLRLDNAQCF